MYSYNFSTKSFKSHRSCLVCSTVCTVNSKFNAIKFNIS